MTKSRVDFRPLSSMQLGIWFESTLSDPQPCENIGEMVEICGPVSVPAFREALRQIVAETDALRTVFSETDAEPRQSFPASSLVDLAIVDVSLAPDPWRSMLSIVERAMEDIIDLRDQKLFSFSLIKLADDHFVWHHRYHHVIIDGFGYSLIAQRLSDLYSAAISGAPPGGPKFGSIDDILDGDGAYLASNDFQIDRAFWLEYLSSIPDPPRLGNATSDYTPLPLRNSSSLPGDIVHSLSDVANQSGTTLSRTIVAAVAAYLCRFSGQYELTFSLSVSARSRTAPGMTANVLPIRLAINPAMSLQDVAARIDNELKKVLPHRRYPIPALLRDMKRIRAFGDDFGPIINVMPFKQELAFAGHRAVPYNVSTRTVRDISFTIYSGNEDGLHVHLAANPKMHSLEAVERHQQFLQRVLTAVSADPSQPIGQIEILDAGERRQLLHDWNDTFRPVAEATLPELFEQQVARSPGATALIFEDTALSYAGLNARANRLAHHLIRRGVGPE
ncbi:condensation domain-containing protein, partial [Bradyrhizobium oligotrophicum]